MDMMPQILARQARYAITTFYLSTILLQVQHVDRPRSGQRPAKLVISTQRRWPTASSKWSHPRRYRMLIKYSERRTVKTHRRGAPCKFTYCVPEPTSLTSLHTLNKHCDSFTAYGWNLAHSFDWDNWKGTEFVDPFSSPALQQHFERCIYLEYCLQWTWHLWGGRLVKQGQEDG